MSLLLIIGVLILIILLVIFSKVCYIKAPPSVAYIISGLGKRPRILIGQGGFRIPILERVDHLFLGQVSVDIKTGKSVPTKDYINVNVDAVAKVMVGQDEESIQLAARNFLNFTPEEIKNDLQDSLEGNMREIIGTLTIEEITTDRDKFSDQVVSKASVDMKRLGIAIISCNIQNVTIPNIPESEENLITDMGADNTARIRKRAAISKAQAERDIAVAQAQANKEANDARVEAELAIAQRKTELAVKQSELKTQSETARAVSEAAFAIQEQEQNKTIQTTTVNAEIAKTEREQELKKQQVAVKEQELAASIKKQAEADRYAIEQQAQADLAKRQREAEASLYEQQKTAEAQKAKAEAARYAAEQEAIGIKAKGEADAAAIQARGEAEAIAMDKKAEAMQKYGAAAITQMIVEILPKVAAEVAKPMERIDKVSVIGNGTDASSVSANVPLVMGKTFATIKEATGVDLTEIVRANSLAAKTQRNITVQGTESAMETVKKGSVSKAMKK